MTWIFLVALLVIPPLLLLQGDKKRIRPLRLFAAILIGYLCINLLLHMHRYERRAAYENCQSQFADGATQRHAECGEINIADGASKVFLVFFGWIPVTGYIGCWELWRRIKFRHYSKDSRVALWFGNGVIIFILPFLACVMLYGYIIIAGLVYF